MFGKGSGILPISRKVAGGTFIRILASGLAVITALAIARVGGPDLKGITSIYVAFVTISSSVFSFSIGNYVVAKSSTDRKRGLAGRVATTLLPMSIAGILIGILLAFRVDVFLGFIVCGISLYSLQVNLGAIAVAVVGPIRGAFGLLAQQVSLFIIVTFLSATQYLSETTLYAAYCLAFLLSSTLQIIQISKASPNLGSLSWRETLTAIRGGLSWTGKAVAFLLLERADILLVGVILGTYSAGIYSVAASFALLAALPQTALRDFLVSRQTTSNTYAEARRHAILSLVAGLVSTALIWPLAALIIPYLLGNEFKPATLLVLILLPGAAIMGSSRYLLHLLMVEQRALPATVATIAIAVSYIALSTAVVPVGGMVSMAALFSISQAVAFVAFLFLILRKLEKQ